MWNIDILQKEITVEVDSLLIFWTQLFISLRSSLFTLYQTI